MRLIYISQGNIPSKWAHTFQAMKMAEAFGRLVPDFRLVTQVHWTRRLRRRFRFEAWYGVRHPFRIVRLPLRGAPSVEFFEEVRFPAFDRAAVAYCRRKQPDLVYTRSEPAGELLVKAGLPTVIETHADAGHWALQHVLRVKDAPNLKGIVTMSEVLREQYLSAGVRADRILVCPDAVDVEAFSQSRPVRELRRELLLPESGDLALYCGHLYANRGIEEILAAARILPTVQFVLIGGWEKDVAARRAEARDLSNVRVAGFVPQALVPSCLAAADVLLMPYSAACPTAEWMSPLKLFEYMASGRPIVATDLPALRLHLQNGRNAVLVGPDDGAALAAGIRGILAHPDGGAALGAEARRDVSALSWENRARAILDRVTIAKGGAWHTGKA